ncbi:hypothetical protein NESM_000385100 [Novymonas esmeraldas]|uniref:Uncharacterized protein n=1 Tax=Novymonas esmeraldas TaxID=1808958 RepID=A0AAW0EMI4_9TRYP
MDTPVPCTEPPSQLRCTDSNGAVLSVCLHRYLRWLGRLQSTIDAVGDDAYTLDRLLRQGVAPLRQRTGAVPTAAEARLRAAVCALLLRDNLGNGQHGSWAAPTAAMNTAGRAPVSPPAPVHADGPPCPCRSYLQQQQREAESRLQAQHRRSSSSSSEDEVAAEGAAGPSRRAASLPGDDGDDGDHHHDTAQLSATFSHFTTRLRDAIRGVEGPGSSDGGGLAGALLAHTVALGSAAGGGGGGHSSPRGNVRAGTRLSRTGQPAPSSSLSLLPVAASSEPDGGGSPLHSASVSGAEATQVGSRSSGSDCLLVPRGPLPVGADTQMHRTLHPMVAHISAEDVRRCALCSAQLLVESAWHAAYQVNLLTLLSAAPSMAAPLPLPPVSVLRVHPTEAMLLLYQCAHRCFVVGVTMATTVGIPAPATEHAQSPPPPPPAPTALEMLRGAYGGGQGGGAATIRGESRPPLDERVLCGLAGGLLGLAQSITGTAAPQLWPRTRMTSSSPPSFFADVTGDVLAMRFHLFHAALMLLVTDAGDDAATAALASACDGLLACVRCIASRQREGLTPAEVLAAAQPLQPVGSGETDETAAAAAAAASPPSSPRLAPFEAILSALTEALLLFDAPHTHASGGSGGGGGGDDVLAALADDVRALCCVAVLLATFAGLVHTRDGSAVAPPSPSQHRLTLHRDHLLDHLVYPCLLRLQNSTRGDCSAQARHLVALWWLLRAETVRRWARTASSRAAAPQEDGAAARTVVVVDTGVLRVLDVVVTVDEEEALTTEEAHTLPRRQHWLQWLKDASRAAVRASDAASEFLGLTFTSAPSSPSAASAVSAPLRWRLPAPASPSPVSVALLHLPWIRLWWTLCHPLFRVSPADTLALRQRVRQDDARRVSVSTAAATAAPSVDGRAVRGATQTTASGAGGRGALTAPSRNASPSPARRRADADGAHGARAPRHGNRGRALHHASPQAAVEQHPPSHGGGGRVTADVAAATTPASPSVDAAARLQRSTEPVCFWLRWSLLFLPPPSAAAPSQDVAAPHVQSSTSPSALAATLDGVITGLRTPLETWVPEQQRTAAPTTALVRQLQRAFPLHTSAELVLALTAQTHLFLAHDTEEWHDAAAAAATAATPPPPPTTAPHWAGASSFAPFSFAAAFTSLRRAVSERMRSSTPPLSSPPTASTDDAARCATVAESPPSKQISHAAPSPPHTKQRRGSNVAAAAAGASAAAASGGARRAPLVAARRSGRPTPAATASKPFAAPPAGTDTRSGGEAAAVV